MLIDANKSMSLCETFICLSVFFAFMLYLYVSLQVRFGPGVVCSLSTASANPNIPVLLNQRVDHAVVRDARVHLLLQIKYLDFYSSYSKITLTATIAPSWSL